MGQPLFTFSSETASLIKFLTVANIDDPKKVKTGTEDGHRTLVDNISDENLVNIRNFEERKGTDLTEKIKFDDDLAKDEKLSLEASCNESPEMNEYGNFGENSPCEFSMCKHGSESGMSSTGMCSDWGSSKRNVKRPKTLQFPEPETNLCGDAPKSRISTQCLEKNLILVTGEFAVALHQIVFKNVPPYAKESVLARGTTPMDADNPEAFMVVNYSNNDIHIVNGQQQLDTPDHLIDLFGHVTGLCLTPDQRSVILIFMCKGQNQYLVGNIQTIVDVYFFSLKFNIAPKPLWLT